VTQTLDWAEVMARVPRERFIPDIIWRHDRTRAGNDLVPVDRRTDPATWAALVAAEGPVITQVDNGHPAADGTGFEVTSSCSDRVVVREMLELLAPEPGSRVLEIGTGTGWNAALLAAAGTVVTTIEIDPEVAAQARTRLSPEVTVRTGDAATAALGEADHLVATVGVREVPPSWVASTRVGGRLVVPLTNPWYPPGLAVLERTNHGTATGYLAGPANFMSLRGEAVSRTRASDLAPLHTGTTDTHPYHLTGVRDAAVAIGQRTSGVSFVWRSPDDSSDGVLWLYSEQSWATIDTTNGSPYEVEQAGPRQLVDEVLSAYQWWREHGEPLVSDWQVTVTSTGQTITLRSQ